MSAWFSRSQHVVSVGIDAVATASCRLVVVHVDVTMGQPRTGGPALNNVSVSVLLTTKVMTVHCTGSVIIESDRLTSTPVKFLDYDATP